MATKDLYTELGLRIQGTQVQIETTRTPEETAWCEFKTQLAEAEARADLVGEQESVKAQCSNLSSMD
jgi:hypothetical protein